MKGLMLPRPIIFGPVTTYHQVNATTAVGSMKSTVLYEPDYERESALPFEPDYRLTGIVIVENTLVTVKSLLLLDGSLQETVDIIASIDDYKIRELASKSSLPLGYKEVLLDKFIGKKE